MNGQQETTGEKTLTQIFGEVVRANRNRHARELNAIVSNGIDISREQVRKFEKIVKTAPKIIMDAVDKKLISIHKAYVLNKDLQKILDPEDRDVYAFLSLRQVLEDKESGALKERQIANRLLKIISTARKNEKFLTEENLDIYLNYSGAKLSVVADMIEDEIYLLREFKLIIQKRRLREQEN